MVRSQPPANVRLSAAQQLTSFCRKTPWRLSRFQKYRQRQRLRAVDDVVSTVEAALAKKGQSVQALERWRAEMPTEAEMLPKDKYTIFDRKVKRYRKGIHSTSIFSLSEEKSWSVCSLGDPD